MLRIALLAIALVAPFLSYGAARIRASFEVAAAVKAEKAAGNARCVAKISELEATHNSQVDAAASDAVEAGEAIETPDDDAEIIAICKRSASCRSRGTL